MDDKTLDSSLSKPFALSAVYRLGISALLLLVKAPAAGAGSRSGSRSAAFAFTSTPRSSHHGASTRIVRRKSELFAAFDFRNGRNSTESFGSNFSSSSAPPSLTPPAKVQEQNELLRVMNLQKQDLLEYLEDNKRSNDEKEQGLRKQISDLQNQLKAMEKEKQSEEESLQRSKQEMSQAASRISFLEKQLEEAKDTLLEKKQQPQASQGGDPSASSDMMEAMGRITFLQKELEDAKRNEEKLLQEKQDYDQSQKELSEAMSKISDLQVELDTTNQKVIERSSTADGDSNKINNKAQIEELKNDYLKAQDKISFLEKRLGEKKVSYNNGFPALANQDQKDATELALLFEQEKRKAKTQNEQIEQLRSDLQIKDEKYQRAKSQMQKMESTQEILSSKITELDLFWTAIEKERNKEKEKLRQTQQDLGQALEQIEQLEQQQLEQEKQRDLQIKELSEKESKQNDEELMKLRNTLKEKDELVIKSQKQVERLEQKQEQLVAEISELNQVFKTSDEQRKKEQLELEQTKKQLSTATDLIKQSEKLIMEFKMVDDERSLEREAYSATKSNLVQAMEQISKLEKLLEIATASGRELSNQYQKFVKEADQDRRNNEKKINDLEKKLDQYKDKSNLNQVQIQGNQKQFEMNQAELGNANVKISDLEKRIMESQKEIETQRTQSKKEVEKYENDLTQANDRINKLEKMVIDASDQLKKQAEMEKQEQRQLNLKIEGEKKRLQQQQLELKKEEERKKLQQQIELKKEEERKKQQQQLELKKEEEKKKQKQKQQLEMKKEEEKKKLQQQLEMKKADETKKQKEQDEKLSKRSGGIVPGGISSWFSAANSKKEDAKDVTPSSLGSSSSPLSSSVPPSPDNNKLSSGANQQVPLSDSSTVSSTGGISSWFSPANSKKQEEKNKSPPSPVSSWFNSGSNKMGSGISDKVKVPTPAPVADKEKNDDVKTERPSPSKKIALPKFIQKELDIPTINEWEITAGGEVRGKVRNHPVMDDGTTIVTSKLANPKLALESAIVTTASGSKYKLNIPRQVKMNNSMQVDSNAGAETTQQQPPKFSTSSNRIVVPASQQNPQVSTSSNKVPPSPVNDPKLKQLAIPLSGDTIANGKYLMAGKPRRSVNNRCFFWPAYRNLNDGKQGQAQIGEEVAVKFSSNQEALKREYNNYKKLSAGSKKGVIVDVHDYLEVTDKLSYNTGKHAIVMELGKEDLKTFRRNSKLTGTVLRDALFSVATCLDVIHSSKMVWSDLKSENFVVVEDAEKHELSFKAIDLESAVPYRGNPLDYTPEASPPEFARAFYDGDAHDFEMHYDYDIWSFGMLAYELAVGRGLFDGQTPNQIMRRLTDMETPSYDEIEDDNLANLISLCLSFDPKKRPSIGKILKHPYFRGAGNNVLSSLFEW